MSLSLAAEIKERLLAMVEQTFHLKLDDAVAEVPPRTDLGDLAFPLAFELAKRLNAATGAKQNPRELGNTLGQGLRTVPGVARIEIAGPGYLNVYFDRAKVFTTLAIPRPAIPNPQSGKLIVEHTSINPNKAAHIGHVRNAVLGDTTARILRAVGEDVEVHNYIDNTGVQVADVVVGFLHLENRSLAEIRELAERTPTKRADSFDYYCWELYSRVGAWYEADKTRCELRAKALHQIEEGNNPTAEIGDYISSKIVNCHLNTMMRLDISYNLLARESEILHLQFWAHAFEKLKASGAIVFETEGRNQGCWVMRTDVSAESGRVGDEENEAEHDADKIIVRSNGTVTYTGKDIAYHLWKLGKLGLDFNYRILRHDHHGHEVWITTGNESEGKVDHPSFGDGTAFLNVIDVGQAYPQANVKRGVMMIDHDERVARSAHLAYEKVVLSADAARELGIAAEGTVSMSGRKGLGVKADDLMDRLEANALQVVEARHADIGMAEQRKIAQQIAVAALRYFLLKFTRTSIIAFDFKEALMFRGETGPYLQYSVRRYSKIFQEVERELGRTLETIRRDYAELAPDAVTRVFTDDGGDELWASVRLAARLSEVTQLAASEFEPTYVAKYAFQLADQFNSLYQDRRYRALAETDPTRQTVLLLVYDLARRTLTETLVLLGIEIPARM